MKTLDEHNNERREAYDALRKKKQEPHANGIACPKCDEELWDSSPMMTQAADTLKTLQAEHTDEVMRGLMLEKAHAMGLAERDAALARLAITEEANSMLLARNKWLEHTLDVAGASPVEPSQALELVNTQRVCFIRGWDARGMFSGPESSEERDMRMRELLDAYYPRAAIDAKEQPNG